jgi:hypothetical protein
MFGAFVPLRQGWAEVEQTLRWLANRWSDATVSSFDRAGRVAPVARVDRGSDSIAG